ncbi:TniQ family protein [Bradyrhizobium sp. BR 10289]|uniref:TniQ family protein n=1 Tax=Bradyrhizobium sp. BR 10289 TaxID=2749993 RepID=UPI001C653A6E|nr:TniQ family protein [Bradyrhizobium sp. BR 10289]MBW7974594.1 TniQ family protein [Bradyrhizobium sp. BR 10289]
MTAKLDLAPPYRSGEPPTAYASRLARAHDLLVRELCGDFGIKHWQLTNGDEAAIAKIAALGGIDEVDLAACAFVRTGDHDFVYRGQSLRRETLVVGRLDVCPRCLVEDARNAGKTPADAAYVCRAEWLLDVVDTCPVHGCAMATVHKAPGTAYCFDFSDILVAKAAGLAEMAEKAPLRDPTGLQDYVLARLDGCDTGAPFLDAMPLFAAIRTCEMLGAAACFGRKGKRDNLSGDKLRQARVRGFEIASRGKEAIEELLRTMAMAHARRRTTVRDQIVRQAFASLYNYLHVNPKRPTWRVPAFAPLRILVSDFVKASFPLKPGDNVLGEVITERRLHSVTSLAKEIGRGAGRVKKILLLAGMIDEEQVKLPDPHILFDAVEGGRIVRDAVAALPYHEVAKRIGTGLYQVKMLVKAGLLEPIADGSLGLRATVSTAAVDAFVARLLKRARPVTAKETGHATLLEASWKVSCAQTDIVRLILDRRLKWVGALTGKSGCRSILVDLREVRVLVHGRQARTISVDEFADRLGLRKQTAQALVARGYVKSATIERAGHRIARIQPSQVKAFHKRYVALGELARARGLHSATMKAKLDAKGIKPALQKHDVFTIFYRRAHIRSSGDRRLNSDGQPEPASAS